MKKILIVSHWMEIGGAERSLLGLLNCIDYTLYNVDLFLCRQSGEFMSLIPKQVKILQEDKKAASIAIPLKSVLKEGYLDIFFGRLVAKCATIKYLIFNSPMPANNIAIEYSNLFTYPFVSEINPNMIYDLVISFLEPHYIVANKVNAKTKVAWMHTDYSTIGIDVKSGYKIWSKFDYIIAISDACAKSFISIFPQLADRIVLIENILIPGFVLEQADILDVEKEMLAKGDAIKLLSVGRFCTAKNFDNVPDICRCILDLGYNVIWFIIGYGGDEALIKAKIIENGMQEHVIMLGKKENPYPYMKACDIYVQPSRFEGKAVTVREAQILNKPVVITDFTTSKSQLTDGYDGVIVPMDNDGCARGIVNLISNKELQLILTENTKMIDYGNKTEINKVYNLIYKENC